MPRPEENHVCTYPISCCYTPLEEIKKIISRGGHMHKGDGKSSHPRSEEDSLQSFDNAMFIDAEPRSCACTPSGQARDFSQILSHPLASAPSGQHCHLLSSSTGLRTIRPASLVIHAFLSCVALTQKIAVFERHPKLADNRRHDQCNIA